MKKLFLTLLITLFSFIGYGQSGWSTGRYYQYKGETWTQTTWSYGQRYCRTVKWHKTYRRGYVYRWVYDPHFSTYRWVSKWYEGYSWYYIWSSWYYC